MTIWVFIPLSLLLLLSIAAVLALRQPVHAALAGALSFSALGVFFIGLGAEFAGLVQLFVYVGAVAVLIVFVLLLTRTGNRSHERRWTQHGAEGILTSLAVLAVLLAAIFASPSLERTPVANPPDAMIASIGFALLGQYPMPMQMLAVLLTAALIGGVLFVWDEKTGDPATKQK